MPQLMILIIEGALGKDIRTHYKSRQIEADSVYQVKDTRISPRATKWTKIGTFVQCKGSGCEAGSYVKLEAEYGI